MSKSKKAHSNLENLDLGQKLAVDIFRLVVNNINNNNNSSILVQKKYIYMYVNFCM